MRSFAVPIALTLFVAFSAAFSGGAMAQSTTLDASQIRALFIGNSLAFHHEGKLLGRRFLAEDGTTVFDPLRGFPYPGRWKIVEETDQLCLQDLEVEKPYCARFVVGDGGYHIDWGDGIDRDFLEVLEAGDTTDLSDNPGPDFEPVQGLPLPPNLNVELPAEYPGDGNDALIGAWFGTLSVWRDFLLIIEAVEGSRVDVVYSWSSNHLRPDTPGWSRQAAEINDGSLNIKLRWGSISARAGENGELIVVFDWDDGGLRTRAVRWEDPSLAPRSPVEILPPDPHGPREKLTFWELQIASDLGEDPLHNGHFTALGEAGPALHRLEGRLEVGASTMLGRLAGSRGAHDYGAFPAFSIDFFTSGDRLVPAARDIVKTSQGSEGWDIILGPGRVWSESADNGWSRAAFPFLLVGPLTGVGKNGLATFLFDDREVSKLRFQVVKESSPFNHVDLWGAAALRYTPKRIEQRAELLQAFALEQANQIEFRTWAQAEARFGAEVIALFDGTAIRPEISHSALIVDGEVYATACRTRYGPYPFCREMRHSVQSVTKSVGGLLSLLRVAERYGDSIFDLKVIDYVDLDAAHDGWTDVTFGDLVSLVTGIGDAEPTRVSHFVEADLRREFWRAPSAQEKLAGVSELGNYPWGPGEVFRYISSGFFVLGAALDSLLKSREGPDAQLWQMMNREVFQPIGMARLPTQHTIERQGAPGLPVLGTGLFATLEDMARIERLIRNQGRHDGKQLLHAAKLRESLEEGTRLGFPTGWRNDQGNVTYFRSFWITPQKSRAGCVAPIPGMSGSGGNYLLLMPNGISAVRFAGGNDNDEYSGTFDSSHMRKVADDIRPLCTP